MIFFKKKIITPRAMKMHIKKLYKESGKEDRCGEGLSICPNKSLTDAQVYLFFLNIILC